MPFDFALIGHQESWSAAADVVAAIRGADRGRIPTDEVQEILPWIPPRAVCKVQARSVLGTSANGIYIDTFIPPDHLDAVHMRENLVRVRQAAGYAVREEAKIVSLGGFSSILLEGNFDQIPDRRGTVFTTGNSLTVAFIVGGLRKMCAMEGRDLSSATLLIVGATGDVGSGCARCLGPMVKRVQIYARNAVRLRGLAVELAADGVPVELSTDLAGFQQRADVVVCAASLPSPTLLLEHVAPDALICDAGYPKNLAPTETAPRARIFYGGLGRIGGSMAFEPDLEGVLNRHPYPDMAHGCLLEGMALALEGRFEPFSHGRGGILPKRVAEIERIAAKHGIVLAPLYNADGPIGTPERGTAG
jgi:predicted amino acid dehydrogenase